MDLFDVARSCARRWYLFLPLLLIAGWFSYSAYSSVQPVYYSQAVIGIAPPSVRVDDVPPGVPLPRNGLLDVGGAPLIANMTALSLRDQSVVSRVVAAGGLPDYDSKLFPVPANTMPLPLIMIEATAADPAQVSKTLGLVVQQAEVTLRTLQHQANVPDDQMVAPFIVSPPTPPAAAMPSRTKSTIAIFVAGVGLSVLLTVVVDVLATRRKSRKFQRKLAETAVATGPEDHPPHEIEQPLAAATAGDRVMDVP